MATEIVETRTATIAGKIVFRKWANGNVYVGAASEDGVLTHARVNIKGLREIAEVATRLASEMAQAEAVTAERKANAG